MGVSGLHRRVPGSRLVQDFATRNSAAGKGGRRREENQLGSFSSLQSLQAPAYVRLEG